MLFWFFNVFHFIFCDFFIYLFHLFFLWLFCIFSLVFGAFALASAFAGKWGRRFHFSFTRPTGPTGEKIKYKHKISKLLRWLWMCMWMAEKERRRAQSGRAMKKGVSSTENGERRTENGERGMRRERKTWVDKWAFGFCDREPSTTSLLKHINNRILHCTKSNCNWYWYCVRFRQRDITKIPKIRLIIFIFLKI